MNEFTAWVLGFMRRRRRRYLLVRTNFWMSGLVAAEVKQAFGLPFVVIFHALGCVRRLHQRQADEFPGECFPIEDRIVAAADHVIAEGVDAMIPCERPS